MALLQLYEAANASTLLGTDTFGVVSGNHMQYSPRYDCAIYASPSAFTGFYKVYRDGRCVRVHMANNLYIGYDSDYDLFYHIDFVGTWGGNKYFDPLSLLIDGSKASRMTSTGISNRQIDAFLWHNEYYNVTGTTVYVYDLSASLVRSFSVTGSLAGFSGDRVFITPAGKLVVVDVSNPSLGKGHVRFYDLPTSTYLYESTFDTAKAIFVDTKHENIWTINNSTGKMQVWSFQVAPQNFSAITMGANRCRYREDALSVTLRGSNNEPAPYWVVKWTLATAEGHLIETYTETGLDGVATNTYCGPGATDYVGGSQTITVETAY